MTADSDDPRFKPLTTCANQLESSMLRTALESVDIPVLVQGENHRAMLGSLGSYVEIRVLVPEARLVEAAGILEDLRSESDPSEFEQDLREPVDGDDEAEFEERRAWRSRRRYALAALMSLPGIWPRPRICGQAWSRGRAARVLDRLRRGREGFGMGRRAPVLTRARARPLR